MNLHVINTGFFKLDGGAMFGVVPKSIWSKRYPADSDNLCTWAMRCLLIEDSNRLILIDTGLGDKQSDRFFSHFQPHGDDTLLASIHAKGFSPDDITDVLLTHLHFDHCGGAVSKDKEGRLYPTFKNATHWSNEKHWNWAMEPNPREKASFLKENFVPLIEEDQVKFISDGDSIIQGLSVKEVHGHTEAMLIPHINYKDRKLVYMADLMPSAAHLPMPYVMGYDIRPLTTLEERASFYKEAVAQDNVLFFEHDKENECGVLKQGERRIELDRTFSLSEL